MKSTWKHRHAALVGAAVATAAAAGTALALAGVLTAGPQPDGTGITPIGWRVAPTGRQVQLVSGSVYADRPLAIAKSPDGKTLAISNDGQSTQSLMIVDTASGAIKQTIPYASPQALFVGLVYSPDGKKLYASAGGNNKLRVYDVAADGTLSETAPIVLPAGVVRPFGDQGPFPAGLAISSDGSRLYVANNIDNTVSIISTATAAILSTTPVGSNPYAVALSHDGKTAYVSNWGGEQVAGPASATAPLGTATLRSRGSLTAVDARTGAPQTTIQVGTHPSALAVDPATGDLYVANTDSDDVSVIDTAANRVKQTIELAPAEGAQVGANPDALAFEPDGSALFVANSGTNAVSVLDLRHGGRVLGEIPTAWYPTGLAVSDDGTRLFVANGKGLGAGPNPNGPTPYHDSTPDQYSGSMAKGTLSLVDLPKNINHGQFEQWSKQVAANDRQQAPAAAGSFPSAIKHVIYVVKENRTYDQLFGDLPKGNGDPSLALFKDDVAPNQRALQQRFVTLDNLYAAAEVSADGWEWSTAANANTYDQKTWPADYSGRNRGYDYEGGNFAASPGKDPENSYIWDSLVRKGVSLRNYGFWATGTIPAVVLPTEPELAPVTDTQFPGYNTQIKDQVRLDEWLREFRGYEASGSLPAAQLVRLPNDHTRGTRPGAPSPRAMVADNDLALGRLVDAVSHSRFWASTAIFVIEDDAQNGPDHVDAHRMPAQVISPYSQTGKVDSTFYSTVSVLRSIEDILGIGPLTQFDASANPMTNAFGSTADASPFTAIVPAASVLAETNTASAPLAFRSTQMDFSQADRTGEQILNEAIWKSVKGRKSPLPAPHHRSR